MRWDHFHIPLEQIWQGQVPRPSECFACYMSLALPDSEDNICFKKKVEVRKGKSTKEKAKGD